MTVKLWTSPPAPCSARCRSTDPSSWPAAGGADSWLPVAGTARSDCGIQPPGAHSNARGPERENVQTVSITANGAPSTAAARQPYPQVARERWHALLLGRPHTAPVTMVAFAPDGSTFASPRRISRRVWAFANGSELHADRSSIC
jgi:hypothetical protein